MILTLKMKMTMMTSQVAGEICDSNLIGQVSFIVLIQDELEGIVCPTNDTTMMISLTSPMSPRMHLTYGKLKN